MMLNVNNYPHYLSPEEAGFWGQFELDETEPPLPDTEAFDWINGRVFIATWPDDDFPW